METQHRLQGWLSFEHVFTVSMWAKGLNGFIETVGGLLLLFNSSTTVMALARALAGQELSEDPHDFVANFILRSGQKLGEAHLFGGLYFITHGLVKIALVYYLLKKDLRAYPWAIGILGTFALYQLYLALAHASVGYFVLTVLDGFILYMAIQEYRRLTVDKNYGAVSDEGRMGQDNSL